MNNQRRLVVGTEDGQLAIDPCERDVMIFTSQEAAEREAGIQPGGFIPDPAGPGLVAVNPWKVYELVECTGHTEETARR